MWCKRFAVGVLSTTVMVAATLDKPALRNDLEDLKPGLLATLKPADHEITIWPAGQLPQTCLDITNDSQLDPHSVTAFSVKYSDCDDPWILCRHSACPIPMDMAIDNFGRLPVGTRQWVRHMIFLPNKDGPSAYNKDASIAMFDTAGDAMTIYFHEAGHSLDLQGAFFDQAISYSLNWQYEYNNDTHVPDNYARSNEVENVAQNIVVAAFDEIVAGGFKQLEPGWQKISHQFQYIQAQSKLAGNLIVPGGRCTHRLQNSEPVNIVTPGRLNVTGQLSDIAETVKLVLVEPRRFDTRDLGCRHSRPGWL